MVRVWSGCGATNRRDDSLRSCGGAQTAKWVMALKQVILTFHVPRTLDFVVRITRTSSIDSEHSLAPLECSPFYVLVEVHSSIVFSIQGSRIPTCQVEDQPQEREI